MENNEQKISLTKFDGYEYVLSFENKTSITRLSGKTEIREEIINVFYRNSDVITVMDFINNIKIFGIFVSRKLIKLIPKDEYENEIMKYQKEIEEIIKMLK